MTTWVGGPGDEPWRLAACPSPAPAAPVSPYRWGESRVWDGAFAVGDQVPSGLVPLEAKTDSGPPAALGPGRPSLCSGNGRTEP